MPSITLCLIAKDEAAMLPACLASVRDAVDDMVVVDTGSHDATVSLAQAAGAQVVHHPWQDDFADARNASLAAARGDYVLVLDADERLVPGAAAAVRAAADGELDCGLLPLHHADRIDASPALVASGRARLGSPVHLPRLLRRTSDLVYHGVIHENVAPWLQTPGRIIRRVPAAIAHYGAIPEVKRSRGKLDRDLRLLGRRAEASPDDPAPWTFLGNRLLNAGRRDEAMAAFQHAWQACMTRPDRGLGVLATLATLRSAVALELGEPARAYQLLAAARVLGAHHPNLDLQLGRACEALHRPEEAARWYRRCPRYDGQPLMEESLPGATSWAARDGLARVRPPQRNTGFVFIGGAGRSGTTLLRAMLGAHPAIYCGPELKIVPALFGHRDAWRGFLDDAGAAPDLVDDGIAALIRTVLDGLDHGSKARIAEKTPHNLVFADRLASMFPDAQFVHLVRDGRAVVASLLRQDWTDARGRPVPWCVDAAAAARYWVDVLDKTATALASAEGRYVQLRYEDLVARPEPTLRGVLDFLGEAWDPAVLSHHAADLTLPAGESSSAAVAQPVHTHAVDRWRQQLSSADLAVVEDIAGPWLARLGYLQR